MQIIKKIALTAALSAVVLAGGTVAAAAEASAPGASSARIWFYGYFYPRVGTAQSRAEAESECYVEGEAFVRKHRLYTYSCTWTYTNSRRGGWNGWAYAGHAY